VLSPSVHCLITTDSHAEGGYYQLLVSLKMNEKMTAVVAIRKQLLVSLKMNEKMTAVVAIRKLTETLSGCGYQHFTD